MINAHPFWHRHRLGGQHCLHVAAAQLSLSPRFQILQGGRRGFTCCLRRCHLLDFQCALEICQLMSCRCRSYCVRLAIKWGAGQTLALTVRGESCSSGSSSCCSRQSSTKSSVRRRQGAHIGNIRFGCRRCLVASAAKVKRLQWNGGLEEVRNTLRKLLDTLLNSKNI